MTLIKLNGTITVREGDKYKTIFDEDDRGEFKDLPELFEFIELCYKVRPWYKD